MRDYKSEITDEDAVYRRLNEFLFSCLKEDKEKVFSEITDHFFAVGLFHNQMIQSKKEMEKIWTDENNALKGVIDYEIKDFVTTCPTEGFIECFCTIVLHREDTIIKNCPYCMNAAAGFLKEEDQYRLSLIFLSESYLPEEFFAKMFQEYKADSYVSDQSKYVAQDLFLSMLNDAVRDPLTGVYNRRSGEGLVEKALQGNTSYVFLVLDIDHFKGINDLYGHQEGDRILQYTVDLMRRSFRGSDIIFRLGGDEFVIFAYPCDDPEVMEVKLQKINLQFQKEIKQYYKESMASLSFGGVCGEGEIAFQELYQKADRVLYEVKRSRKNRQMIRKIDSISEE